MILGLANIITGFMGGNVKDAKSYGFLPTASASTNKTALNNALTGGGTINITTPGVYNIDDTIYIPSNTTLKICNGFNFRKTADFGPVLMNKGALTGVRNTNIRIYGNGCLFADLNGYEDQHPTVFGLRGIISFLRVDNFVVDGITYVGTGTFQFFFQLCDVTNGLINNLSIQSPKDAIDISGPGSTITIINITTKTTDDGLYLGCGWPTVTPLLGDIDGITITNWTDKYFAGNGGQGLLFQSLSWLDWSSGNTYTTGDIANNAGHIYRKINSGSATASAAPVHTSGSVTGADGIQWQYLQDGTFHQTNVRNVTITNATQEAHRPLLGAYSDNNAYNRSNYPGTFGNGIITGIVLDNAIQTFSSWVGQRLIYMPSQNIGTLTVKNTTITPINADNAIFQGAAITVTLKGTIDKLIFDNCHFDFSIGGYGLCQVNGTPPTYPFVFNTLQILNSYIKGASDISTDSLFSPYSANQFTNVLIQNTTLDNLERLIYFYSGTTVAISMINSTFENSKYLIAITDINTTVNLTATNCVINDPIQYLFFNNQSTSPLTVYTSGTTGTITHAHVSTGGGNITITGDLP